MSVSESRQWIRRWLAAAVIVLLAVSGAHAQGDVRKDAIQRFAFRVEIQGAEAGFFKSVSGLSIETEVIEFREGGQNDFIHKLPGVRKYPNIVLKRGFTGDKALYDWFIAGTRVNGKITMIDARGVAIATWNFNNGFPAKWTGPEFDASKNEVAIETLEIAHEGLTMN